MKSFGRKADQPHQTKSQPGSGFICNVPHHTGSVLDCGFVFCGLVRTKQCVQPRKERKSLFD